MARRRKFGRLWGRKGADGKIVYYVQWVDPATRRRVTRAVGTDRDEAVTFLLELELRIRGGAYSVPATVTQVARAPASEAPAPAVAPLFGEYAQKHLDERLAAMKAKATITLYRSNLKALRAYFGARTLDGGRRIAAKRLDEINALAITDFRVWRKSWRGDFDPKKDAARKAKRRAAAVAAGEPIVESVVESPAAPPKPISDATINRDVQFASVVLSAAVADGLIPANPLTGFKKLREARKPRRYLSKAEVARLILQCGPKLRPIVLASLFTGCRPCELRSLRWRDVSFDAAKIMITRTKVGNADALDLHPKLAHELKRLRDAQTKHGPGDHVFTGRKGKPYRDWRKAWRKALDAAGLGDSNLTPYSLRHTFATHFLQGGGSITDLCAQLGHSDIGTTQLYADMVNARRRDTLLSLDWGTPPEPPEVREPVARYGAAQRTGGGGR